MKMRKGSMMLEISIAFTVLVSLTILYTLKTYYQKEHMAFDTTMKEITGVLEYGVFNKETGYMSGVGGYCSNGINVNNISVARVVQCADLNSSYEMVSSGDETVGANSYIHFMGQYSDNGQGCNFYFDDLAPDEMYVFMDCNITTNERAENFFVTGLQKAFPDKYKNSYMESISLSTDTGGTEKDGKARVLLKK